MDKRKGAEAPNNTVDKDTTNSLILQRNSFVFYRSFYECIDELEPENQLALYRAITQYGLDRKEPRMTGVVKGFWVLIRPQLAANWRKYENGLNGKDYGSRGGAPFGNKNAQKQPQNNPYSTPNDNDNDNLKENGKENGKNNAPDIF